MPLMSEKSDHPWAKDMYRGRIYVQCIKDKLCKTAYLQALKSVSAKATSMKLTEKLATAAKVIDPWLQVQYGTSVVGKKTLDDIHTEQSKAILFVSNMQVKVSDLLTQNGIK
jgi:hypothetical protein